MKGMSCPNCKKELEKLAADVFYCDAEKEVYRLIENKLSVIKDKPALVEELAKRLTATGEQLRTLADKLGVEVEEESGGLFGF